MSTIKSRYLTNILNSLVIDDNIDFIGSFKNKEFKYPSDIDIVNFNTINLDKLSASEYYSNKIYHIILNLPKNIIFKDFKIGNDIITGESLHWKEEEILNNFKNNLTLKDAIYTGGLVKADFIIWFEDRFQIVEIIYLMSYNTDLFYKRNDYAQSLIDFLKTNYYNKNYLPLKILKRLYLYAKYMKNEELKNKLIIEFNSKTSGLNQILTDFDTIILICRKKYISEDILNKMSMTILSLEKRLKYLNHKLWCLYRPSILSGVHIHKNEFEYWKPYLNTIINHILDFRKILEYYIVKVTTPLLDKYSIFFQSISSNGIGI